MMNLLPVHKNGYRPVDKLREHYFDIINYLFFFLPLSHYIAVRFHWYIFTG